MAEATVAAFVHSLKEQVRLGHATHATEHHLRREFARLGWQGADAEHARRVDEEINRLIHHANTLLHLRTDHFGPPPGQSGMADRI